jgi:hypothetical protein
MVPFNFVSSIQLVCAFANPNDKKKTNKIYKFFIFDLIFIPTLLAFLIRPRFL